jgi:hypothetical protein
MSTNTPTTATPPTVPPAIAPLLKELLPPELGGLVLVVVAEMRAVFVVDVVVAVVAVAMMMVVVVVELGELEVVVAEVVSGHGIRLLFEMNPSIEAPPIINPAEMLSSLLQHELFPQQ